MKNVKTASQREEQIKEISRRITKLCAEWYEKVKPEQQVELMAMLDDLENALVAYRSHDIPWDSVLIEVVEKIGERQVKAKAFSTFESVMDKARDKRRLDENTVD
jgi:hypothetical protein